MKKSTKLTGSSLIILMIMGLLYKNSTLSFKTYFTHTRQLITRLVEQAKSTQKDLKRIIKSSHKVKLSQFTGHLSDFNARITPQINKIQLQLKQLKNDSKN